MIPIIAETGYEFAKGPNFNTLNIYLDGRVSSDLSWESLESEIATALKLKAKLSFEIDFGLSLEKADFQNPASFFSRGIAVQEFEERVYRVYKPEISTIIVYRGSGDFKQSILNDASLHEDFLEWKGEFFKNEGETDHMFRLFSMEILMQYLHRLMAPLIDEIPLVALFNFQDCKRRSFQAELLSKAFFPYIIPGVKGAALSFNGFGWESGGNLGYIGHKALTENKIDTGLLGVVLPKTGKVPYDLIDKTLSSLDIKKISYSVFSESLMIENFNGLDHILVFSGFLTEEGRRMLQGFNAAGGIVVIVGESLNLVEEIEAEEFIRSRGI